MVRTKLVAVAVAAAAFVGGPLAAAPAHAQPCEVLFQDPYDYPCTVARDGVGFVLQEVGDALVFVNDLYDEAGEVVFRVACIAFPSRPECQ